MEGGTALWHLEWRPGDKAVFNLKGFILLSFFEWRQPEVVVISSSISWNHSVIEDLYLSTELKTKASCSVVPGLTVQTKACL